MATISAKTSSAKLRRHVSSAVSHNIRVLWLETFGSRMKLQIMVSVRFM